MLMLGLKLSTVGLFPANLMLLLGISANHRKVPLRLVALRLRLLSIDS